MVPIACSPKLAGGLDVAGSDKARGDGRNPGDGHARFCAVASAKGKIDEFDVAGTQSAAAGLGRDRRLEGGHLIEHVSLDQLRFCSRSG